MKDVKQVVCGGSVMCYYCENFDGDKTCNVDNENLYNIAWIEDEDCDCYKPL